MPDCRAYPLSVALKTSRISKNPTFTVECRQTVVTRNGLLLIDIVDCVADGIIEQ